VGMGWGWCVCGKAFSIICHEGLMHAGTMGLKVIFTDHSLFGFSDPSAIHMNKVPSTRAHAPLPCHARCHEPVRPV
jgi:hypothetical protein